MQCVYNNTTVSGYVCVCGYIVGHHDGEQRFVVGIEGHVQCGGLDHDQDGMQNWRTSSEN